MSFGSGILYLFTGLMICFPLRHFALKQLLVSILSVIRAVVCNLIYGVYEKCYESFICNAGPGLGL